MATAILTHGNTGVGTADLHIELGIRNGVADLLVGSAGSEHGKRGAVGDQSHGGQSSRNIHHIGLSNAAVIKAIRMGGLEILGHRSASQIGIQHNDLVVLCA